MNTVKTTLAALRTNEDGATMIEYGLIVALVAVALVGTFQTLKGNIDTLFSTVGASLTGG